MAEKKRAETPEQRYRVLAAVSARRQSDRGCTDWIEFVPGETYGATAFPAHVRLDALVASGRLQEV